MQIPETVLFWLAVLLYAGAFVLLLVERIFRREKAGIAALRTIPAGFTAHTAALVLRWLESGYPPFVTFFESVSASCWFGVLSMLLLIAFRPRLRKAGVAVLPAVFLLLGWASTPSNAPSELSASLHSVWLFIHASFATAGVGAFLVAAGISVSRLLRHGELNGNSEEGRRTEQAAAHRFVSIGFLLYTVMILSGAIWARQAWGRYWGWDPIETWSLITWLTYALYLHLHFTFPKLRERVLDWYAAIAVLFAAFSLWGVGFVYRTIHTYG
ncbi:MAG: cytochrome c biogenesis protein CcsA [Bacteroidetes bacterium]|nr:cytochrome c biogenesis protein CcsA [Bacteroidota bacterium]